MKRTNTLAQNIMQQNTHFQQSGLRSILLQKSEKLGRTNRGPDGKTAERHRIDFKKNFSHEAGGEILRLHMHSAGSTRKPHLPDAGGGGIGGPLLERYGALPGGNGNGSQK